MAPAATGCNGDNNGPTLWYDADGRVRQMAIAWWWWGLTLDYSLSPMQSVQDSVFRGVSITGATGGLASAYQYFYDALGRRRAKLLPVNNSREEYFYDLGHGLLSDVTPNAAAGSTPTGYTVEDFVWLGGMPVAMERGLVSTAWVWQADGSGNCTRWGLPDTGGGCGTYHIINDRLPKPVMVVDFRGSVAGTGSYDEFGALNRIPMGSLTPSTAAAGTVVATVSLPTAGSVDARANYGYIDLLGGTCGVAASNGTAETLPASRVAHFVGGWRARRTGTNDFQVVKSGGSCAGPQGIETMSVEYRQYAAGVTPMWVPFRMPGQYFDPETDFFENWNRYYFPDIGRYLSPDPVLLKPRAVRAMARRGLTTPTYAYGNNNPIYWTDPTGLVPYCDRNSDECRRNAEELARQQCRCRKSGGTFRLDFADATPDDPFGELIIGGSCDIKTPSCPSVPGTGWSSNVMTDLETYSQVDPYVTSCP